MAVVATGDGSTLTSKTVPVPPANYTVAWNDDQRGYVVDYRVTVAGTLSIGVTLDGKHITSSPFSAQVAAGATAAQRSVLTGVGLRGTVVGRRVEFHLQAKDSFGNLKSSGGDPFRLSLRCLTPSCGGSGALLAGATINDIGDGTYTGSYMSSTEGTFSLEVTLRNDAVGVVPSRSPFSVSISAAAGPISLRNTEALGLGLSEGRAGTPAEFTIIAADTLGIQLTEGGNLFSAEVKQFLPADGVEPSGPGFSLASRKSGTPNSIVDNQDGTYTVSFTANTAAYYSVMVWGDAARTTALAGSWPVKMRMYAAPTVASACLLDPGQPLPTVVPAGRIIKTGILAFDRYGNRQQYVPGVQDNDDFSIAAVSDTLPNVIGSARMSADKQGYDLELVVSTVGIYRIDIRLKNRFTGIQETIGTGSTYPLQVTSGVLSAERSTASGLGLLGGIVGQTLRVSVLVSDTGGNPVAVSGLPSGICQARLQPQRGPNAGCTMGGSSVGPSTGICDCIPIACQSALGSPNRYNLDMAATCAGDYVLRVLLGNSPINSSPFPLTISPGETAPSRVVLAGTGLSRATAGSEATFTMQAADAYGNLRYKGGDTFAAWLEHSPAGGVNPAPDVYATVTDSGDGTYSAVYTPEGIGSHQLYVQLAGKSTGESPYTVTVRASETSASASYIIGGKLDSFRAGEVVELTVVAVSDTGRRQTDGPSDRFDVSMSPDGNGFGFVLTPVAERTSQDAATYEIRFTAERVVFNGDGSRRPYRLEVTLAGKHVKGSPMELHVRPGPVAASRSALFGAGDVSPEVKDDYGSVAGVRRDLLLQMRDIYGNDADYDLFAEIPRVSLRVAGMPQDPFTAGVDVSDHIEVANTEVGRSCCFCFSSLHFHSNSGGIEMPSGVIDRLKNSPC